ncbi:B-cell receptor CD22-like [Sinocyclocheilus rhinocerous]|uniref:B-cell receptor CD22-like n=1 Tax=Sinocyclocheilus rhinocerous TaxID=307959 RepID=UPI0007B88550|nr:PREDICTED: B-cell receptor CD22-like [Sinocyclocheilus rhinocerous]
MAIMTLDVFSPALQVKAPQLVLEKQTVGLTCETTCNLTDAFIWYKNRQTLKIHSKTLQLQSERSDSGRYSCAVRGHEHLPSPAVSITVVYPPQNVSVSRNGSGEIVEGDSVALSCSSDSNPPAEISWFKGETLLGSGDTYSITDIKSEASGNYYCSARNKHGSQASAAVTVNVMYPPKSIAVSINGSGEIVEGDSVTLSCSSDSNPPALNFSWFKENQSVGSGQSFSISSFNSSHSGRYYCEAQNQHGSQRSKSVSVTTSAGNASESGDDDKILYASVQCRKKHKDTKKPEEDEIQYASVTVRQPATEAKDVNTAIMELLIMAYALKTSCAKNIIGVIPYFPYSKQCKMRKRGSIVCKLLASMLAKAGLTHIITMDLHQKEIQGFFTFPVDNLRASPFLVCT